MHTGSQTKLAVIIWPKHSATLAKIRDGGAQKYRMQLLIKPSRLSSSTYAICDAPLGLLGAAQVNSTTVKFFFCCRAVSVC